MTADRAIDRGGGALVARHLPVLLRPAAQPWAVRPASGAVVVAVLVLGVGTAAGRPVEAGLTYFGVACAAVFVTGRHYRVRVALVGAQAAGAIIGMAIGAVLPTSTAWVVAVATVVAGLCGAIGSIGPASTAFGMMGVIGLAFTQFSRLGMPWWEPPLWYLLGSGLVLAAGLVGALHHPRRYQRAALAEVFAAAAALVRAPGGDTGARSRLARASAGAREAVLGYRIRQPGTGEIDRLWTVAEATALRVASHVPDDASDAAELDRFAEAVREGRETLDVKRRPALGRPAVPWDRVRDRDALLVGARLAVCVGVATLVASLLHSTEHAYWIPLTVATVLRPEYGSVFARFVHRALGTVAGVLLMACTLSLTTSAWVLITVGALALGFAVLAGPRLYGLSVVGITTSALVASALADPARVEPWIRLGDTALGCLVVLVLGYLVWPRHGEPDPARRTAQVAAAVAAYADLELRLPDDPRLAGARDEAYRWAHTWHNALQQRLADPPPAGRDAAAWTPVAARVEDLADAVSAAGARIRAGNDPPDDAARQEIVRAISAVGGPRVPDEALAALASVGRRGDADAP
jgi:uncharacterized membrane protein YccC